MDILLLVLLAGLITTAATRTGRKTARAFTQSARKAAGWRTPREALHHHAGRAGAVAGRLAAAGTRRGRRAAARAGQKTAALARRRWEERITGSAPSPPPGPGSAPPAPSPPPVPPAGHVPGRFEPGDAPWKILRAGTMTTDEHGNLHLAGWEFADPHPHPGKPARIPVRGRGGAGALYGHTVAELHDLSHGPGCPCPAGNATIAPGLAAAAGTPGTQGPGTGSSGPPPPQQRKGPMNHYAINLEPPASDGEFLESCVRLGDVLKSLAAQIGTWADGLAGFNLPAAVLNPLHQVSDGITDAAAGAAQAAKAFEDEFEDARDVAARGMTITGQDAA
jgi:hypothetical protein